MKQEISREGNQDVLNFSTRLKALRKQSWFAIIPLE
jgi:hypothetical protein